MKRKLPILAAGGVLIIAAAVIAFLSLPKPVFSKQVIQQFDATLLSPQGSDFVIKPSSVTLKNIGQDQVLNYTVQIFGVNATVGEQATPEPFIDIPQYYPTIVNQSKPYATMGVDLGTVYLTKPNSSQLAMLNTKGTYMLVRPDKDLSQNQWHQFFQSLVVLK